MTTTRTTRGDDDKTMARRIRLAYEFERGQYLSILEGRKVPYRAGRCWDGAGEAGDYRGSVWLKILHLCRAKGIDPVLYIRWHLHVNTLLAARPPEPNQLLGGKLVAAFLARDPALERRAVEIEWNTDLTCARREINYLQERCRLSEKGAHRLVLFHEGYDFSPLFRFCLALGLLDWGEAFRDIAERYVVEAALQYSRSPDDYDAVFGRLIPPDFRAKAAAAYDAVIGMAPPARPARLPRPRSRCRP